MRAATRSITIDCEPSQVLTFVSDPSNLPLWSKSFCLSIRQEQGQWVAQTPQGPIRIRIATHRQLGIADQFLTKDMQTFCICQMAFQKLISIGSVQRLYHRHKNHFG